MAATGQAGNPSSLFHEPSLSAWLQHYGLSDTPFADDHAALTQIFRAARQQGTAGTGIFGVRLQRHSFPFFTEHLRILHPDCASDAERIVAAFGKTLFIHLTRDNKLDQAISLLKANQTGLWHMKADGTEWERTSPPQNPAYNADEIARNLADLTKFDADWAAWFNAEGITPLRLCYDTLSANPRKVIAGILNQLGVDPALADILNTPLSKLADVTSTEWAARFHAARP